MVAYFAPTFLHQQRSKFVYGTISGKMLSHRLLKLFKFITLLGQTFGSCLLSFDVKTCIFFNTLSPTTNNRLERNFFILKVWAALSFTFVIRLYRSRELERFHLTFFFWLGGIVMIIGHSILKCYSHEVMQACRNVLIFLKYIQGKGYKTWKS